ncbi:hypothetical protein CGRA01v4_12444, partial [Colletotrichum graminicola]
EFLDNSLSLHETSVGYGSLLQKSLAGTTRTYDPLHGVISPSWQWGRTVLIQLVVAKPDSRPRSSCTEPCKKYNHQGRNHLPAETVDSGTHVPTYAEGHVRVLLVLCQFTEAARTEMESIMTPDSKVMMHRLNISCYCTNVRRPVNALCRRIQSKSFLICVMISSNRLLLRSEHLILFETC